MEDDGTDVASWRIVGQLVLYGGLWDSCYFIKDVWTAGASCRIVGQLVILEE